MRDLDRAGAALTDDEKVLKAFLDKNPTENFRPRLADFGRSGAAGDVSEILYVATGGKFDGAGIAAKLATRR
ncbi:MAG: hypothetical protein QG650_988 [Patescibacteria group bacterium]|nr:hypothetical protein [Patescibacteria group bacterium]